ncbi:hypothetical protein K3495_g1535 [Podosphaera aphanis]|nr:hypothetical protein K3495_g1535 [Podosphaera aphanis]
MTKSQHPPPLVMRVAKELELVQRVAKGRATWVQSFHNKFWSAIDEADPLIQSLMREQMGAFLFAVASGHHMRHDNQRQHKLSGSLPKPSQSNHGVGHRPLPALPPLSFQRRLRLDPPQRLVTLACPFQNKLRSP